MTQHQRMMRALCEALSDHGLVSFLPINIQDGEVQSSVDEDATFVPLN